MNESAKLGQVLRDVVSGERDWKELSAFGITVAISGSSVKVIGGGPPIRVGATEIARGWLRHSSDENALRAWARFVHGAVGLVELDVDDHPLGEKLLDSLWRASFGESIREEMHLVARNVLMAKAAPDNAS